MTWICIDTSWPRDPRIRRVSVEAAWLHLRAICLATDLGSDGLIVGPIGPQDIVSQLVDAGLWYPCGAGYRIADYEDYQPLAPELEARRAAATARERRSHEGDQ